MKCFVTLTEDERLNIFNKFYSFDTKNEQDIYLQGCIEVTNVVRHRKRNENGEERQNSFCHYVLKGITKVKVCQTAFLNLHGITNKRLKRLKNLLVNNIIPQDMRGKTLKSNAIPEIDNILIREHIGSFPVKESHYSGKAYHYLNSKLNVKKMYEMFKEKHPKSLIRYSYYIKIFHEHFNLHFGRPQIDTCCQCEDLSLKIKSPSLSENSKRAAVAEMIVHKRRAKKFYTSLQNTTEETKERNDIEAIAFDFMQNLHLPEVPVQDLFYLTQLSVNVFCIHNLNTGKAYFYLYHEGIANKGPNEVCSFIMDYITNYVDPDVRELRLYSDNCPGQNKNHTMVRMCMALVDSSRFTKVQQFYPVRGHSFLPCDRDFGVIKRSLRKIDRIYSIHEYTEIIIKSSKNNKFVVKEVSTADILNWKDWWPSYYKKTCLSNESVRCPRNEKQSFSISKMHHIIHDKKLCGHILASEFINSFLQHHFKLAMPNKTCNLKLPVMKAYVEDKVPILETKVKHLKLLVRWVTEEHKLFFEDIIKNWKTKKGKNKNSADAN